jgi:hypothetical protein
LHPHRFIRKRLARVRRVIKDALSGCHFRNPSTRNPHSRVTSNLALPLQSAHHRQGGSGKSSRNKLWRKSFVLWILASNSFAIWILQTLFVNPVPSKAFKRVGGGGDTPFSQINTARRPETPSSRSQPRKNIYRQNPQGRAGRLTPETQKPKGKSQEPKPASSCGQSPRCSISSSVFLRSTPQR